MKIKFDTPPKSAEVSNGIPVQYSNVKREVPRWRWYLILALVMLIPLYFMLRVLVGAVLQSSPGMVVVDQVVMRAPITGKVEEVAQEGVTADEGARMVRVVQSQTPAAQVDQNAAQGAVDSAEQSYAAQRRELQGQQGALKASLQAAQERLSLMRSRVQQMEQLFQQGAATRQEVDAARMQMLQVQSELGATQREILAANQQQSALYLQAAKDAASTRQAAGVAQMANLTPVAELIAPVPGQVTRSFVKPGEWVVAGDELLVLQTRRDPWIQAYLTPEHLKFARKGQKATLVFLDGQKVAAEVEEVFSETQRLPADRVGPMEAQSAAVVVKLKPLEQLPAQHRVNRLPIDVRFNEGWWPWSGGTKVADTPDTVNAG